MSEGKIPTQWMKTDLDNVLLSIVGGGTPSKANSNYYQGDIPWMSVKDMNKNVLEDTIDHISQDAVDSSSTNVIPAGVPIIATRMSLGKIVVANFDTAINQDLKALFLPKNIDRNYLIWWYRSIARDIESLGTGTTVKGVRLEVLRELQFPVAPLAEQQVIAEKLDTLLAQVESIKAYLKYIPRIIKQFRQSVLAAAVSGKLTEEWRQTRESELNEDLKAEIENYRFEAWVADNEEKFRNKGKLPKNDKWKDQYNQPEPLSEIPQEELPRGWVYEQLEGLVYISARIGWKGLKASEYTKSGPLFLSVHSLNYGNVVKLSEAYHVSEERYHESPEIMLKNDDILLCKDGAGIGKLGIVKNLNEPATINSSLLLIRSGKFFVPEYLFYFLAGPRMQNIVQERMTGSAVPHLFQRDVKAFVLEVPPIEEQKEIVKRIEAKLDTADRIERLVQSALDRVENLTQSILAKAFRGDLTTEWREANQELISEENSAEALLERIKAERELAKPATKRGRGKA